MLLPKIEKFLRQTGMPSSKFGRLAAGDPRLVSDMRRGREPRAELAGRIARFMDHFAGQDGHAA